MCFRVGFPSAHGEILHLGLGSQIGRSRRGDIGCLPQFNLKSGPRAQTQFCPCIEVSQALDQMLGKLVRCFLVALVFLLCTFDISDSVTCQPVGVFTSSNLHCWKQVESFSTKKSTPLQYSARCPASYSLELSWSIYLPLLSSLWIFQIPDLHCWLLVTASSLWICGSVGHCPRFAR